MARAAIIYRPSAASAPHTDGMSGSDGDRFEVVAVVRDESGPRHSGLTEALERIAAGEASTLVTAHLSDVAGSLRELVALLDWLAAANADLVVVDEGIDTATAAGKRVVAVLREVERWEREPEPGRPPRGRPGLAALAPKLTERITAMRENGQSLQAIADALNADGVPTQRGGARWRPSSVQSALGYRRPRAPAPGVPPPPPPHPPGHAPPRTPRPPGRPGPPRHGGRQP